MKFLFALSVASLAALGANAMRDISSKELVKEMKVGWSLGNTLDAECLSWLDYEEDQTASETCWGVVKTTEGIFTKLISTNFNVFRIPTTWSGHIGSAPEYKINDKWMKRVHEIVDYAYKNGAFVILNIHHEIWNHAFSKDLPTAKIMLEKVWGQIAEEFKDYDEHLIFEGLNEPRKVGDPVEWTGGDQEGWNAVNEMNAVFMKTIRQAKGNNPKRHLMIPPYAASVTDGSLNNFIFPSNDDKVIASVHAYSPYNFALNNGAGAVKQFDSNGKNELDWIMQMINQRFISKNIPVIIGEYGAMNRDNESERARWVEYYIQKATSLGIPCVWWDNAYFEGEGERFGLIDRTTYKFVYPEVVKSMLKGKNLTFDDSFTPSSSASSDECWAKSLGYSCCSSSTSVYYTDSDGSWGVENGNWCGIITSSSSSSESCWSESMGYPCCSGCDVYYTDNSGKWGVENNNWCGILSNKC